MTRFTWRRVSGRRNHAIWLGPIITGVAGLSYFLYFARFAALRDFPWLNLLMVAFGVLLSIAGVWRAFSPSLPYRGKILGTLGLIVSVFVGGFFNVYIFSISYSLPEATGVSLEMATAPDFTLIDQHGAAREPGRLPWTQGRPDLLPRVLVTLLSIRTAGSAVTHRRFPGGGRGVALRER